MLNFLSYSGSFRNLVDISFVCAMGPPGGGRNPITPRLARHFNYLSFTELEDSSKFKLAEREGEGGMLMSVYVRGGQGGRGGCVRNIWEEIKEKLSSYSFLAGFFPPSSMLGWASSQTGRSCAHILLTAPYQCTRPSQQSCSQHLPNHTIPST